MKETAAALPVRLGPLALEHPFVLAPMAGVTSSPFRRLMRRMKSALVVSELVSANGVGHGGGKSLELLRFHEEERPVGLQLFGEDTEPLLRACRLVEELGADFVDLNLGCPVAKVVKRGAGAAMCRDPAALGRTLGAMVRSVGIPVTIKIRAGWDATSRNAAEVVRAAADAGVAWVAIHGRTRAQGYGGEADWNLIGEIKAGSPIPVVGNGDVTTPERAVECLRTYGVDAVMIGRGALRNPFIFEQALELWKGQPCAVPATERYLGLVDALRELLEEVSGEEVSGEEASGARDSKSAMIHARKFLSWYASGYPGCHEFRKRVFSARDPGDFWAEAKRFFAQDPPARGARRLDGSFLAGGHG